jgi:DNA-binding CsgD family transcriptional regulator
VGQDDAGVARVHEDDGATSGDTGPLPSPAASTDPTATAAGRLSGEPRLALTPGAYNPAVTQATIGRTICVSGWTATIRPSSSYTCEPALTVIPNFLLTGLLAMTVAVVVLVWATAFGQRKHGGAILPLLIAALFLVGGGFVTLIFGGERLILLRSSPRTAQARRARIRCLPRTKPRSADPLDELTGRERQVLELVAAGLSNAEIGGRLGLAEKTVKHYMTAILGKLQVGSRVEAALVSYKAGVHPDESGPAE